MAKVLTYQIAGEQYVLDDLTIGEAEELEAELGLDWGELRTLVSMRHTRAVLAKFLARTLDADEAQRRIRALTFKNLDEMVTLEDDGEAGPDPKAPTETTDLSE